MMNISGLGQLARVADDLRGQPAKTVRQGRGAAAKRLDAAAATAQQRALATWTTYGRGMRGSAGTIRARMSRDKNEVVGYVYGDGEGIYQSERGSGTRAPQPVLGQAVESQVGSVADELGNIASNL